MKKALKKLKIKSINKFKHFLNMIDKILKVTLQSSLICYPMAIVFIIVNSVLGVHIRVSYYIKFATIAMIGIAISLTILNWKKIISKPIKVSKKTVPTDNRDRAQRRIQRNRRNIS